MAGFDPASDLNARLAENCGVDFAKLKAKYSKIKQETAATGSSSPSDVSSLTLTQLSGQNASSKPGAHSAGAEVDEAMETFRRLDKYKVCNACNGAGVIQYTYNHMKLEKTCEVCDGDIVIDKEDSVQQTTSDRNIDE